MYINVLTEIGAKATNQKYLYHVPAGMEDKIKVGIRVKIPFGRMTLEGFVMEIVTSTLYDKTKIKDIIEVIDERPVLNDEMILLGEDMSKSLLCSMVSSYQVMLPKALKASAGTKINIKYNRYLRRVKSIFEIDKYIKTCKYDGQIRLLCELKERDILITRMNSTINTIVKHGLGEIVYEEEERYEYTGSSNYKKVVLTEKQEEVVKEVTSSFGKSMTYLLYGVTGSGKTEVYMCIIEEVLKQGKSAIMLVPEISLTPQIVGKFMARFGKVISVLHSRLSDSERYDEYRKITKGEAKIVIGTRSAIFVPFSNIGVIIIDEEHTSSYKQENHPRYHAIDIARWRSKYHNCPVVLGSATPSLESFARAGNHIYKLLTLPSRALSNRLPEVKIIDMKEEMRKGNFILSRLLKEKIKDRLEKKEQIILLLNRRGYSGVISCRECGYTLKCPKCDISYTYHKTSNNLKCHYCGTSIPFANKCPKCGSSSMKDYGLGTEKLEEELRKMFEAKIVRMDVDTTSKKGEHQKIIDSFGRGEFDILIGTQMIAKGLDFPTVTLVGVVSADSTLTNPSFRAAENTFQLLSQVAGRAGRGGTPGEVIIQTFNPDHYSIVLAKEHNYVEFYKQEMKIRKLLKYSPYYYMTLISLSTKDYEMGFREMNKIRGYLVAKLSSDTIVLGPSMASAFKVNNVYHYQIIIKYQKDDKLRETLKFIDDMYKSNSKVEVEMDFNPIRI